MNRLASLVVGGMLATLAQAQLTAVVVVEPTARKDVWMVSRAGLESSLSKLLGQAATVVTSEDLTDAMRATRSGDYDVFIAPAQVVASALAHGYELVGATDGDEQYVLVGRSSVRSTADMRKARIYLPQQDSIYTYMARGMLTGAGLSFKDLGKVEYARLPQAGLVAVGMGLYEATVVRREDWDLWMKDNPGATHVLATSGSVPGGLSVAIRNSLPIDVRSKLARMFTTSASSFGMRPVAQRLDLAPYRKVAELGTFTPVSLPGVRVVKADEVKRLIEQGAVVVDTRTEKEFKSRHIPGALLVPYHEKSLKDVAYDPAADDFTGLARLDPARPTVFHCNGAECWKSYKASKAALARGFTKVYWFRGGVPEWDGLGMQTASQ